MRIRNSASIIFIHLHWKLRVLLRCSAPLWFDSYVCSCLGGGALKGQPSLMFMAGLFPLTFKHNSANIYLPPSSQIPQEDKPYWQQQSSIARSSRGLFYLMNGERRRARGRSLRTSRKTFQLECHTTFLCHGTLQTNLGWVNVFWWNTPLYPSLAAWPFPQDSRCHLQLFASAISIHSLVLVLVIFFLVFGMQCHLWVKTGNCPPPPFLGDGSLFWDIPGSTSMIITVMVPSSLLFLRTMFSPASYTFLIKPPNCPSVHFPNLIVYLN